MSRRAEISTTFEVRTNFFLVLLPRLLHKYYKKGGMIFFTQLFTQDMRMRCRLLTKSFFCSLFCFGLSISTDVAFAQVYKSYDADGNVVFSDKPSERSKEVEISKPNVTDPFKIPPPPRAATSPESKPEAPAPEAETQPSADDDTADTNNDGRISRREKEEFRKEQRRKKRETEEAAAGN
jgi:hypothetical protein